MSGTAFTNELTIGRESAEVFAFLADVRNAPGWNYAITESRQVTPGPIRVGTVFEQVRTVPSKALEQLTIVAMDPPRRLAIEGQLGPFDALLEYELSEDAVGTRLVNSVRLQGGGLLGALGAFAGGRIQQAVARNLEDLRSLLERER